MHLCFDIEKFFYSIEFTNFFSELKQILFERLSYLKEDSCRLFENACQGKNQT